MIDGQCLKPCDATQQTSPNNAVHLPSSASTRASSLWGARSRRASSSSSTDSLSSPPSSPSSSSLSDSSLSMSSTPSGSGSAAGSGGAWYLAAVSIIAAVSTALYSLFSRAPPSASLRCAATAVRTIFAVSVPSAAAAWSGASLAMTASTADVTMSADNGAGAAASLMVATRAAGRRCGRRRRLSRCAGPRRSQVRGARHRLAVWSAATSSGSTPSSRP